MLLTLLLSTSALQSVLQQSSLAGNVKFDPLDLASKDLHFRPLGQTKRDPHRVLNDYREAELKHARLAVLASVAYPSQESLHPFAAAASALPNALTKDGLSPSLANGDLTGATVAIFLALGSMLELSRVVDGGATANDEIPGDFGWRAGLDPAIAAHDHRLMDLQDGEIWNGRLAMIAILGYVVQEAITKQPVLGLLG